MKIKEAKIKGSHSFPCNYTCRDFEFEFYGPLDMGSGEMGSR